MVLFGLIGTLLIILDDMRGENYDENYFTNECKLVCLLTTVLGYLTMCFVIVFCIVRFFHKNKPITKTLYKIANVKIGKNNN